MKIIRIKQLQIIYTAIIALCMISPPLANLLELILFFGLFFCRSLHETLLSYVKTFDFKIHLSFVLLLLLGVLYPLVDTQIYLSSILNWRKFLLLPLGIILFHGDQSQKQKSLTVIFFSILILTVLNLFYKSHLLYFFNNEVIRYEIGTTSSEGMFVAAGLAIVLSSIVNKSKTPGKLQWIEIISAIFLVIYIALFTTGRSGYLAMLAVLIFMAMKYIKVHQLYSSFKSWFLLVGVTLFTVILLMSSKTSSDRIDLAIVELQQSEKNANENLVTSIGQRVIFWKNTVEMIPKYFILGAGTGAFKAAYTEQVAGKTGLTAAITQDPHNQYLKILIEQGILGLILLIFMIARTLLDKDVENDNFLLGSAVIFIWILTSCFNAHFTTFMEGTFIWGWMGLMNKYTSKK